MNQVIEHNTAKDAVPVLQAENLVSGIWQSVENYIVPDMLYKCFTDDGISETCGKILESEIFYRPETDNFYIRVHTQYYKTDAGNIVFYAVRQIGRKLNVIKYNFTGEASEALGKALKKTVSHSGLVAIQKLLKTEPQLIRMSDEIDPHGFIMTPGGCRDPFTGSLLQRPGSVFTKCTNYNPEPGAVPVQFYKFLSDVFKVDDESKTESENDEETNNVILRLLDVLAAAITGSAPQLEKFLIFSGPGGTGKQQLLECLENVLGDYFVWMRPESLYEVSNAGGDTPRSDLLRIQGSLIIGISEPSDAKISASLFKTLGSGEPIPCRPHHSRHIIEVRPRGLFIIATNRKPYITHDSGVDRRIECYEFSKEFFKSKNRIPDIGVKIAKSEGPQILGELIRRAAAWKAEGGDLEQITESPTVKKWTENYLGWSDVLGRFLNQETSFSPGSLCSVSAVHKRFTQWADENGENRMSGRAFGEALNERGIKKVKKNSGWKFTGIELKSEYEKNAGDNDE